MNIRSTFVSLKQLNIPPLLLLLRPVVRPEKFQFLEKGQNRKFGYEIVISVKNPEFIL